MQMLLRIGACLPVAFFWVAFTQPWFRSPDSSLNGHFALAISASCAAVILAAAARTRWLGPAAWFALGLLGQAVALQLIDAGNLIHYQHYRPLGNILADGKTRWLLLFLVLQTVCVAGGLARRGARIRAWVKSRFRRVQVLAILAACCAASAAVSREPSLFVGELWFAATIQLINLGNILLVGMTLPPLEAIGLSQKLHGWLGDAQADGGRREKAIDRFAILAALWVTVVSAGLAWFVYQAHPHVADELVYLYPARYFAAGQVRMAPPPVQAAFDVDLMEYPPGWPAVLALGVCLGVPWLVNPVLAGINILLAYALFGELYSRRLARLSVALLGVSPWYLFMSMNFMTHTFTLTCALAGFLALALARRTGKIRWAWLAGAMAGAGSLIRPLDGLIVAVLMGLWALAGAQRLKLQALAALVVGTILMAATTMPYNKALTGSPFRSPLMAYTDEHYGPKSNAYGFGPERGLGWGLDAYPGHTPFEALINSELNTSSINVELFGWSTGSLILLAVLIFSGEVRRSDYLMLAAIAAVVLAYAPYWFSGGPDFGARYWYLVLVPCTALSARGLQILEMKTAQGGSRKNNPVLVAAMALCVMALVNYFPWRSVDKYYHYLRMRPDVRRLARAHNFGRSLVLINGDRYPDYASAAIYNPLDLRSNESIYVWNRNPAVRAQVLQAYPDRPVWVVDGSSVTSGAFKVIAGPLDAQTLIAKGLP
jgi:hypothetical protein